MVETRIQKMKNVYHEYPRVFWILMIITFVDRIGEALLFPFFALYITSKFNVGMADVGILVAAFSLSSFVGSALGGALTDRFGRKGIIIFVLIASSASSLLMGLTNSFEMLFVLALFVGILSDVAGFIALLSKIGFLSLNRMRRPDSIPVTRLQESTKKISGGVYASCTITLSSMSI